MQMRGGGGRSAVAEALEKVLNAITEADGREMVGRRGPKEMKVEIEAGPAECEACARGECMDPEHASEEEMMAPMGED